MDTEKAASVKIENLTTTKKYKQVQMIFRYPLLDHLGKNLPKGMPRSGYSNMRSQRSRWLSS